MNRAISLKLPSGWRPWCAKSPKASMSTSSWAWSIPRNRRTRKPGPHLQKAVRLKPDSASARTNLAANLMRLGKAELAGAEFRKAVELEPKNFDTNHNLGEFYVHSGKVAEAARFLAQAQKIDPSSYDNGYDLSLAYVLTGRLTDARELVQDLLKKKNTAELHNLLGEIEEKDGKFVEAANEYETAAHMDPSESNLFDWGSELLIHRTLGPAIEVFQHATERYPKSPRLIIGLGMALYSRGNYDEAVKALLHGGRPRPLRPQLLSFSVQGLRQLAGAGGRGYPALPPLRRTAAAKCARALLLCDEHMEGKAGAGPGSGFAAD